MKVYFRLDLKPLEYYNESNTSLKDLCKQIQIDAIREVAESLERLQATFDAGSLVREFATQLENSTDGDIKEVDIGYEDWETLRTIYFGYDLPEKGGNFSI